VAVLAVIVNHFSARLLPGGYLGVDVFFVISGFVITGSLAKRPAGSLSDLMLGFYSRRIRRLLPALLLCVVVTAVALCLVNPDPGLMLGVGWRSLFGTSNLILHQLAVDYFRPAAELNPFTQTWTLGVEEQFYLLFPLLVWFSGFARHGREGNRRLFWLLIPLLLASFGVFLHWLSVDQSAAYYLLLGRFWELGAGCLLFLLLQRADPLPLGRPEGGTPRRPGPAEQAAWPLPPLLALAGLVALMAVPLPFGVVPVGGAVGLTVLLLGSLRPGTAGQALLSQPPLVFLGLISYSLYLWHWSVLSLARWSVGLTALTVPVLLVLTLGLAVLSWRYVEEPLRRLPWWPERWQVVGTGLLLAASGLVALQGLTRYGSAVLYGGNRTAADFDPEAGIPARDCQAPGQGRLLLVGDSHAHHFSYADGYLCGRHGLGYAEAATVGVPYPTLHYTNSATGVRREDVLQYALAEEERWRVLTSDSALRDRDVLVLSLRWPIYFDPGFLADSSLQRTNHFDPSSGEPISRQQALASWIDAIGAIAQTHPKTTIVVMLPTPEFGGGVPMEVCRPQWFRPQLALECRTGVDRRPMAQFSSYLKRQLQARLAAYPQVLIYDPLDALCPPREGRCPRQKGGFLLYSDGDHLSAYGASLVLDHLVAFLRQRQRLPSSAPVAVTAGSPPAAPATSTAVASP